MADYMAVGYDEKHETRHAEAQSKEDSVNPKDFERFEGLVGVAEEIFSGLKTHKDGKVVRSVNLESVLKKCNAEREWAFNHPSYSEVSKRLTDVGLKYGKPKPVPAKTTQPVKRKFAMPWAKSAEVTKEPDLKKNFFATPSWRYAPKRVTHVVREVIGKPRD